MGKDKLKVGLLLDGTDLEAWAYRMVEIIKQSDYAEIALIIQTTHPTGPKQDAPSDSIPSKIGAGRLWHLACRRILIALERRLVGKPGFLPSASEMKDGAGLLAGVEVIKVTLRRHDGCDHIDGDELASIRACDLDVLVLLGFRTLRGGILGSARHGVWCLQHGDTRVNCSSPAGYWEVMESCAETESTLRLVTEDPDSTGVMYRSSSSTEVMSLADTKSTVQWKALHFIPRKLKELYQDGSERFFARLKEENAHPQFYDRGMYGTPTNGELSVLLWKKLLQKCDRKWDDMFFFRQWFLLYDIRDDISTTLWRFKHVTPPRDRGWADPFVVARDNKYYVFIEEVLYAKKRGHISVLIMNRDGTFEPPVPIVEAPYHLSYPFIFEFENGIYMVPESKGNRTIELYKCTAFPFKWEFQKNLMEDCWAVDPTLIQWQGKWWMFVSQVETEGASLWDELFLYCSDSPLSDNWTPHPRNPIVSDVRSARPAGRCFVRHGRLYRPSQNCSAHYGYGFNICEVTTLTETDYEERIVEKVEPKWDKNVVSTHTFNYADGLTIIDGQLRRRR
jgi:hypothetical protein